jgi:sugar phosphate isomerase/epimerase
MENLKVGIQLYSLRDEMEKDVEATLKKVAEIGYEYVEFAGFHGKTAEEMKSILDKYRLTAISVHQNADGFNTPEKMQAFIEYVKTLGIKFVVIPWMNKEVFYNEKEYAQLVKTLTEAGKIFKENGLTLCYHNHDFEFDKVGDKYILDRLYEDVPQDLLMTELDLCWVKYGGEDPVKYVNKYANRSELVHFKDFYATEMGGGAVYALIDENGKEIERKKTQAETAFKFMPLGKGVQDFEPIVDEVKKSNISYVIYEKDQWYDGDPFEDARISREFLKEKFGI